MKGKNLSGVCGRRLSRRMVMLLLPWLVVIGIFLPFLFIRAAFEVLESAALCSSSSIDGAVGCITWRFFGGTDALLTEELRRALLEATASDDDGNAGITALESLNSGPFMFKDLVEDMMSNKQDIRAFAFKAKAMITEMELKVQKARRHESISWHVAAYGVPKSLHCLSLNLAEEYAVNAAARSCSPLPQYGYRLTDPSFHHIALLTDNVLAASVVISSTIKASMNPEKLVFHVVTDKKTYNSMHAWFAVNSIGSAVFEVKGLHQYDWSHEVNVGIKEMLDIHHQIRNHKYKYVWKKDFDYEEGHRHKLNVLSDSSTSLLNHLRVYLPELFPDLDKVVFLDDDVVVQHDLSRLWDVDLEQKVVGAVVNSWCGQDCCPGRKYSDYFNFTNPMISSNFDQDQCGWLYGMNVFDLKRWRRTNITAVYHQWLKHNLNAGFALWHPGALPPALIAFQSQVHRLDPSWHLAGLGHHLQDIDKRKVETAAVIHFSGLAKPWLEIGSSEVKALWYRHIDLSNEHLTRCGITS